MLQSDWSGIQLGFCRRRTNFFRQKLVVDLFQDERIVTGKFGCSNSYGVEMHKEHIDILHYICNMFLVALLNRIEWSFSRSFRSLTHIHILFLIVHSRIFGFHNLGGISPNPLPNSRSSR